jgi:hypothetical protein
MRGRPGLEGSREPTRTAPSRGTLAWLLVVVLFVSMAVAWKVYDELRLGPDVWFAWFRPVVRDGARDMTLQDRHVGIAATAIGLASFLVLALVAAGRIVGKRASRPWPGLLLLASVIVILGAPVWHAWLEEAARDAGHIERARAARADRHDLSVLLKLLLLTDRAKLPAVESARGKDVLLALVAYGVAGKHRVDNLRVLFPEVGEASMPGLKAYEEIDPNSLGSRDFGALCGYVGPNGPLPPYAEESPARPVLGDVSSGRTAIVGYSNGAIRTFTRTELGLRPDEPLVVGDEATSPILRQLSAHSGP